MLEMVNGLISSLVKVFAKVFVRKSFDFEISFFEIKSCAKIHQ